MKYNVVTLLSLGAGLILFLHGLGTLLYSEPAPIVYDSNSMWPFQEGMADFSFTFVLGLGFLLVGLYRFLYKRKIIAKHSKWEKEQKEKELKSRRNWGRR